MNIDLYEIEKKLHEQGYRHIAGTDEAGRGPMAGPLVAAAVILPADLIIDGLDDSKKLTPKKRDELYDIITKTAVEYQIVIVDVDDVDSFNVYQASKKAMMSCICNFETKVDYILTDAMKLNLPIKCMDIIKGDSKSAAIAAASIIAKVTRDRYMEEIDKLYPEYGFKSHKGYVTKMHLERLERFGPSPIHRKTFEPVRKVMMQQLKLDL